MNRAQAIIHLIDQAASLAKSCSSPQESSKIMCEMLTSLNSLGVSLEEMDNAATDRAISHMRGAS